jgi:hypothetical protein
MFIATSAHPKILAPLGAIPGRRTIVEAVKAICAPAELVIKEEHGAINISPLWGEATTSVLLHFKLESTYLVFQLFRQTQ